MVPDKFDMVDMGGIDIVYSQGTEVPGLYQKLVESITQCRYQCLYNWMFNGVLIPPTYVQLEVDDNDNVVINEGIEVDENDVVHIYSIEPAPIVPVIEELSVNENGIYGVPAGVDGYNPVVVNVSPTIQSINIYENGMYVASEVDGYSPVVVNVPVGNAFLRIDYQPDFICTVSNGITTLTAPDTSGAWIVPLPDVGEWTVTISKEGQTKQTTIQVSYGYTYEVSMYINVDAGYTEVEYIGVGSGANSYINTGLNFSNQSYFELKFQYTSGNYSYAIFGAYSTGKATQITAEGYLYFQVGGTTVTHTFDTNIHVYKVDQNNMILDNVNIGTPNWNNVPLFPIILFAKSTSDSLVSSYCYNARIYHCKIYNGSIPVRDFYPCYRDSDNEPGMFDAVNKVFYPNNGSGSFIIGPEV